MTPPIRADPELRHVRWWYAAVLAIAAVLRFVGLHFAPRTPWGRPDEEIFATVALGLFDDWNTHYASHGFPEAYFRWHHLIQRIVEHWWSWLYPERVEMGCAYVLAPWRLIIPVRYTSAAFGVATVAMLMVFAYRVGPRDRSPIERHAIAIGSGLFYAVNALAARDAHFAVSDTMMVFFFVWMLAAQAKGILRRRAIDALIVGIAYGVATSAKWTGLSFGLVPVIGFVWLLGRHGLDLRNVVTLLMGILGFAIGFAGTSWAVLFEPETFYQGLTAHSMRFDEATFRHFSVRLVHDISPELMRGWYQHGTVSLPFAFGYPLYAAAAAGTVVALIRGVWKREPMTFAVGAWTVAFYVLVISRTTLNFSRYSLPIHPTASVAAMIAVVLAVRAFRTRLRASPRAAAIALAAIAIVLALPPAIHSARQLPLMVATDTRDQAIDWLREHVGEEPVDSLGGYARIYAVEDHLADRCAQHLPEELRDYVPRLYGVGDPGMSFSHAALYPVIFRGHPPPLRAPWIVIGRAVLPCGAETARYDGTEPPACFTLEATFSPGDPGCAAVYDEQDHYYAPLWGHTAVERTGPEVRIYRNRCP